MLAMMLALLFSYSSQLHAQAEIVHYGSLHVTSANNIDWEIDAIIANFGDRRFEEFSGNLVWVDDGETEAADNDMFTPVGRVGCVDLVNKSDVEGNVAFISRGSCEFGVKLLNAERAGAIAGIVANVEPFGIDVGPDTYDQGLVWMGAGVSGDTVTIPGSFHLVGRPPVYRGFNRRRPCHYNLQARLYA